MLFIHAHLRSDMLQYQHMLDLCVSGQVGRGPRESPDRPASTERRADHVRQLRELRRDAVGAGGGTETCLDVELQSESGHHPAGNGRP